MTMDSSRIFAETGALPTCSPALGLRVWPTWLGDKLYVIILSKQVNALRLSGKPGFLLLEKGATNMDTENKSYDVRLELEISTSRWVKWWEKGRREITFVKSKSNHEETWDKLKVTDSIQQVAVLFKNMKVVKDKERQRNCSTLKKTEQTWQVNSMIQC